MDSEIPNPQGSRRIGTFYISSYLETYSGRLIQATLADMEVLDREYDQNAHAYRYTALSHLFDPIPAGAKTPTYRALWRTSPSGQEELIFRREIG